MIKAWALRIAERSINRILRTDPLLYQALTQLSPARLQLYVYAPTVAVSVYFDKSQLSLRWLDAAQNQLAQNQLGQNELAQNELGRDSLNSEGLRHSSPQPNTMPKMDEHGRIINTDLDEKKLKINSLNDQENIRLVSIFVPNAVALMQLLTSNEANIGQYQINGDVQLVQQLKRIIKNAQPNIALQLQPFIGVALAGQLHRFLQAAQAELLRLGQVGARYANEWIVEDSQLLPPAWMFESQLLRLQQLQQRVERLDALISVREQQKTDS